MKNSNNILKLKRGQKLVMVNLDEGIKVAIPTLSKLSNIRILDVNEDGSFTAHWNSNYNLSGDFRTELMLFDADLILDEGDLAIRNSIRKANNLIEIK